MINIFDLGTVEIMWQDPAGILHPLEDLVEGSITVVDGAVVCAGVRRVFDELGSPDPDGVARVVLIPQDFSIDGASRIIYTVEDVLYPTSPGASGVGIRGSLGTADSGYTPALDTDNNGEDLDGDPSSFNIVWQGGIPLTTVIGVTPTLVTIVPDSAGENAVAMSVEESLS